VYYELSDALKPVAGAIQTRNNFHKVDV